MCNTDLSQGIGKKKSQPSNCVLDKKNKKQSREQNGDGECWLLEFGGTVITTQEQMGPL